MNIFIANTLVSGKITPPSSKSMLQRSIATSFLSNTETTIIYNSICDDSEVALRVIMDLGAEVGKIENEMIIQGGFVPVECDLNFGESGLALRMFTPILALYDIDFKIITEGTLRNRPAIDIKRPLQGGIHNVDGSISSQFLTGLLMALPLAKEDSVLNVVDLKSKSYIDMTLDVLESFGVKIVNENYKKFTIKGGQSYSAEKIIVENDWSSAANFIVAGVIAGSVEICDMNFDSYQPDKNIIDIVKTVGAKVERKSDSIIVSKNKLKAFVYNATDSPDLFPPLVVLASACKGKSRIKGVLRLKHKESNRAEVLVKEFTKLGINISVSGDEMIVEGGNIIGGEIDSHNDHRIAMAGAIAGLVSEKGITVKNAECVKKSYPDFFKDLDKIMDN
ncbi:MAG: 3-phosphoshikimate 1-carboxyvinyltransferase [Candidatus Delongbacteria bacterium]|jgi:3-phosphoshikimate 1-carboxyvinyltransferase|nr:3-phosphoshikimate 1-carboxyvinyltransferase [Candidatus Delongbacteria bacterium]